MYEIGADSGRNYSVNVPLKEGIDDECKYNGTYAKWQSKNNNNNRGNLYNTFCH